MWELLGYAICCSLTIAFLYFISFWLREMYQYHWSDKLFAKNMVDVVIQYDKINHIYDYLSKSARFLSKKDMYKISKRVEFLKIQQEIKDEEN